MHLRTAQLSVLRAWWVEVIEPADADWQTGELLRGSLKLSRGSGRNVDGNGEEGEEPEKIHL